MSTEERELYFQKLINHLVGGISDACFWFEPEVEEFIVEEDLFNETYYNFDEGGNKSEQIIYKSDNIDLRFSSGIAITTRELLYWRNEVRTMRVLRRNSLNGNKLHISLAYSRYNVMPTKRHDAIIINHKPKDVRTCVRSYLEESICIELDSWEDRSVDLVKPHWKYFGRLDCSTSIFQSCQFGDELEAEIRRAAQRSNTIADLVVVNNFGWLDRKDEVRGKRVMKNKEKIATLFSDLDMNRTEGKMVRGVLRLMSVKSDPIKLYLAVKGVHPDFNKEDVINETILARHRGDFEKWLYITSVPVTENGTEIDEAIDDLKQMREDQLKAASENENKTEFEKLFETYKYQIPLDEELINAERTLDLMYEKNKRHFEDFQDSEKFQNALQHWKSLQASPRRNTVKTENTEQYKELNILKAALDTSHLYENSFGVALGHSLMHAVKSISNGTNWKEEAIFTELATGVINSYADLFRRPGWKMKPFGLMNATDCIREFYWDAIKRKHPRVYKTLLTTLANVPYYAKMIEAAKKKAERLKLKNAKFKTPFNVTEQSGRFLSDDTPVWKNLELEDEYDFRDEIENETDEMPEPNEIAIENLDDYSNQSSSEVISSEESHSRPKRLTQTCSRYDKYGYVPIKSYNKTENQWFYGFGSCETDSYEPTWMDTYANLSTKGKVPKNLKQLKRHLGKLRVFCYKDSDQYLEHLFKENVIYLDGNNTLFVNRTFSGRPKHTPIESRMMCFALELRAFTSTFRARDKRNIKFWKDVAKTPKKLTKISLTVDFIFEMTFQYVGSARRIHPHFIKLCRSFVLTLRTILLKLIQDNEFTFLWCPMQLSHWCAPEYFNNQDDQLGIHSLIQFLIHGLRPVERQMDPNVEKIYSKFFNKNYNELLRTSKFYDLH
ncbi:unnamed protein product [Orchesella dallaii]|uniref:Uncharacterized protein n=1 Tax=Orchesella dallaii TaxID=48710 RepID=A0ABP1R5K5_9HEXA